ncbi:macro domain-containing protein CT2219-like isoform X2 [Microplitis mediator]|uniref:macro domain-containing protein CT2219-like isoform X2 n=1 Tax=Microplitis mediator TaxID=375433 RepID=UPI0025530E4D|nr:macro domain-containing protein CT2219-like isoform X2 [Microplitis mediator]
MLKLNITTNKLPVQVERIFENLVTLNSPKSRKFSKMSFETEKERFLKMELVEKRKYYHTADIITSDQLMTWPDYWRKNKDSIKSIDTEEIEKTKKELANKISIMQGDITSLEIDAIVNAANSSLLGGGGVDGAIHRASGPNLKKECATLNGCRVGEAKITGDVIHTVGPRGENPGKLKECYLNSLNVAKQNNLKTIAFPCISTGVYGYPQRPAAKVAITTVKQFLQENVNDIEKVIFCLFLDTDKEIYEELLQKYFATD